MIVGIGNDIIEIKRIEKAAQSSRFLERYYTEAERALFAERKGNYGVIAGNFSVKESVSKALGTGFRNMELAEIEVLRDDLGKPYINLYGQAKAASDTLGITSWHVSISNIKDLVSTVAIGEKL